MNLRDSPRDLRLNGNHFARDRLADRVDIGRHILHNRRSNGDGGRGSIKSLLGRVSCAASKQDRRQRGQINQKPSRRSYPLVVFHIPLQLNTCSSPVTSPWRKPERERGCWLTWQPPLHPPLRSGFCRMIIAVMAKTRASARVHANLAASLCTLPYGRVSAD